MESRLNAVVIEHFRKDPTVGRKALGIQLANPQATVVSKLQLISLFLDEQKIEAKEREPIVRSLPRANSIVANLLLVSLPHQKIDSLINFLLENKKLSSIDLPSLYYELALVYFRQEDPHGEIYFLCQALKHSDSTSWAQRHKIHLGLGRRYGYLDQDEKMQAHLRQAYQMETSRRVDASYIQGDGLVSFFLNDFNLSIAQDFTQPDLALLDSVLQLVPDNPRIIKAMTGYVKKGIKHSQHSMDAVLVELLLKLVHRFPTLKDKAPVILGLLVKIPEEQCALSYKANCFYSFQQYDRAIELAQAALKKNATDIDALVTLGMSLRVRGQHEAALAPFLSLLQQKDLPIKKRQLVLGYLSGIYVSLGKYRQAIQYADLAISINTMDVAIYLNLITATGALGERRQAKKLFDKAKSLFPSSKELDSVHQQYFSQTMSLALDEKADSNTILGQIYLHIERQQYDDAHHKAAFLLKRDAYKNPAHIAMATLYRTQKNYSQALEHLLIIKNSEDTLAIAATIMYLYYQLRQYVPAEEYAWLIVKTQENTSKRGREERVRAMSTLLSIYYRSEHYVEGIEALTEALSLKGLLDLEKQKIYHSLTVLHYSNKNFETAMFYANQAINISPQQVPAETYLLLGFSCYSNDKTTQAIEAFRKFIKINPHEVSAHLALGSIYHFGNSPSPSAALDCFSRVLALDPSYLIELSKALPKSLIEQLLNPNNSSSLKATPSETTASSSTALSLSSLSLAELKTVQPSLSAEQLAHRLFQAEKKRQQYQLQRQLFTDEDNEEKRDEGWVIPDYGFLSSNDPAAPTIAFKGRSKSDSHLHGFLHTKKLEKSCPPKLLSKWQMLLVDGGIVGKTGEGIRMMNSDESAEVTANLGNNDYTRTRVAKLKTVTHFGNWRAYAWLIEGRENPREKLLCFDAFLKKSHSK